MSLTNKQMISELTELLQSFEDKGADYLHILHSTLACVNFHIANLDADDKTFEEILDVYSNQEYCDNFKRITRQARQNIRESMNKKES